MKTEFPKQILEKSQYKKFLENSSKGTYVVQYRKTDRDTNGHAKANSRFSKLLISITKRMKIHRRSANILTILTGTGPDTTLLSVISKELHTKSIGWHNCFGFGNYRYLKSFGKYVIQNLIWGLSGYISSHDITIANRKSPIYYKLRNAQWSSH